MFPFSGDGVNKQRIVDALTYSGLGITMSTTDDQIYEKLRSKFPATKSLIVGGWRLSGNASDTSLVSNTSYVKMTLGNGYQITSYADSPSFSIDEFRTLGLVGSSMRNSRNGMDAYMPRLYLVNTSNGASTLIYKHSLAAVGAVESINLTYNVSSLKGTYYLRGEIYSYEATSSGSPQGPNGSGNTGAYFYLTKALLSA